MAARGWSESFTFLGLSDGSRQHWSPSTAELAGKRPVDVRHSLPLPATAAALI